MKLKTLTNLFATVVLVLGVYQWLDGYAGQPRAGRLLGAMMMFYASCVLADKLSQQPYAGDLIRLGSCVALSVLLYVMSA